MRILSNVKRKKRTKSDPYKVVPIPPKSVVRLASTNYAKKRWPEKVGSVYRIGYYGRRDGLDCIWLVDDDGQYKETIDHEFLFRWYDIIMTSEETNLYGIGRPKLPEIRSAETSNTVRKRLTSKSDKS